MLYVVIIACAASIYRLSSESISNLMNSSICVGGLTVGTRTVDLLPPLQVFMEILNKSLFATFKKSGIAQWNRFSEIIFISFIEIRYILI